MSDEERGNELIRPAGSRVLWETIDGRRSVSSLLGLLPARDAIEGLLAIIEDLAAGRKPIPCKGCRGTGICRYRDEYAQGEFTCPSCHGTGKFYIDNDQGHRPAE